MAMESDIRLLVVDADLDNLGLITTTLTQPGLEILSAVDPEAGLEVLVARRPQVVLLDPTLSGDGGMDLLERMVATSPATDVILMTADYSTQSAVEAIRKGA